MFPEPRKFYHLSREKSPVPVWKEIPLQKRTPCDIFAFFWGQEDFCFLLESQLQKKDTARYSFIGINPYLIFKSKGGRIEIKEGKKSLCLFKGNPFKKLADLLEKNRVVYNYHEHFWGGAIGYFGYESVRFYERVPCTKEDILEIPDIYLAFVNEVITIDHLKKSIKIIVTPLPDNISSPQRLYSRACRRIGIIEQKLSSVLSPPAPDFLSFPRQNGKNYLEAEIERGCISSFSAKDFKKRVKIAKRHILRGDIYQINLSQQFILNYPHNPLSLYQTLRMINPSPFGGLLKFMDLYLISSSPERLIKVKDKEIQTRPIAGTRPRGIHQAQDLHYRRELILNKKERAEHIMLVDLARNDLGRICRYSSVRVNELMLLEAYSHVWHIVSSVSGQLKEEVTFMDIFKACFPGGTITGCPKIKTMELINQLEPVQRGYYTGSMGYIGYNGDLDLNILIRTILLKDKTAYFNVGAGIVADSDPEREYEETLHKARALFEAIVNSPNEPSWERYSRLSGRYQRY